MLQGKIIFPCLSFWILPWGSVQFRYLWQPYVLLWLTSRTTLAMERWNIVTFLVSSKETFLICFSFANYHLFGFKLRLKFAILQQNLILQKNIKNSIDIIKTAVAGSHCRDIRWELHNLVGMSVNFLDICSLWFN